VADDARRVDSEMENWLAEYRIGVVKIVANFV
jgi:hypothetical protein